MTDPDVEAVARAIYAEMVAFDGPLSDFENLNENAKNVYRGYARAAIAADPVRKMMEDALTALLHQLDTDDIGGLVELEMERARSVLSRARGEKADS